MVDQDDRLVRACERIADALERLNPPPPAPEDWLSAPAYLWREAQALAMPAIESPPLPLLRGIDRQKRVVVENISRLARGHAAHDMLLWGARGSGKSALVRSAVAAVQEEMSGSGPAPLALVQLDTAALDSIADLVARLGGQNRNFLVFIDDLGFDSGETEAPRKLRSLLEGGVAARPQNVRLAVTANRRALVSRAMDEQDDPINPRDAVDDQLALADRFGLSLGFHACSQADFLAVVRGYAEEYGLSFEESEALEWAKRRGACSGRVARHFITELAGRAGLAL